MTDFYTTEAQAYHHRTFHMDPTSFLAPLCRHIPAAARMVDIGCGSGRDMRWLNHRGYPVIGVDRSFHLAAIAVRETGCPVIVADFERFDFTRFHMDGMLLVAALVHIPPERFHTTLHRLLPALNPGGHLLITLKEGRGVHAAPDGRVFFHWSAADLEKAWTRLVLRVVERFRQASLLANGDVWLSYVLQKTGSL